MIALEISNFWYYTIMVIVIAHVFVAFGYLMYKLSSPKKKQKKQNE
jgi:hypothetical protein